MLREENEKQGFEEWIKRIIIKKRIRNFQFPDSSIDRVGSTLNIFLKDVMPII
jgi:hypothetical protein